MHALLSSDGVSADFDNRVISLLDEGHYGSLLRASGVPVTCLGLQMGRFGPGAAIALQRAMRAAPADIIQGWMPHGNLAASLARWFNPKHAHLAWNVRMSLDYFEHLKPSTRLVTHACGALSNGADAIVYNSARSRIQHEAAGFAERAGHVIPNGFDTSRWRPLPSDRARVRSELAVPEGHDLLGFVGRNDPYKNIPNLLRALSAVMPMFPRLHVALVGRDLAEGHAALLADLPQERVRFLGQRSDVDVLMRGFDLLCLSSDSEGFPNVIGEAMASGLPCVTTDAGDAGDIVGETGWVAPPRDYPALAAALQAALSLPPDARLARGVAARARIKERYGLGAIVTRYQDLYLSFQETN